MKPILFNADMVRAILDGRKTVTRRVVKLPKSIERDLEFREDGSIWWQSDGDGYGDGGRFSDLGKCVKYFDLSPYRVGDILYVRETWCKDAGRYLYRANYSDNEKFYMNGQEVDIKWHPSIHMPRDAARIWLRVKNMRAERLQEITDDDIQREGVHGDPYTFAASEFYDRPELKDNYSKAQFAGLWNNTIKPADRNRYGWAANPWVWVVEFERCEKPKEAEA